MVIDGLSNYNGKGLKWLKHQQKMFKRTIFPFMVVTMFKPLVCIHLTFINIWRKSPNENFSRVSFSMQREELLPEVPLCGRAPTIAPQVQ